MWLNLKSLVIAVATIAMPLGPAQAATYVATHGSNFGLYVDSTDGTATLMLVCHPMPVETEAGGSTRTMVFERLDFRVNSDSTFGEGRKGSTLFYVVGTNEQIGSTSGEFDWSASQKRFSKDIGFPFVRTAEIDSSSVWKTIEASETVTAELWLVDRSIEEESERLRKLRFVFDLSDFHEKRSAVREQCRSGSTEGTTALRLY